MNKWKMTLPTKENNILQFKNHSFKEFVPFVLYSDLECILESTDDSKTENIHIPHSIAYYLHCSYDNSLSENKVRRGSDCINWFINQLRITAHMVDAKLKENIPMEELTAIQIRDYNDAEFCHICNEAFTPNAIKHRDHCHFTGKYRGPSHPGCNINYIRSHDIPVVFHNMSGYDAYFLIKGIATEFKGRVNLLPINKERYISFTKKVPGTKVNLRFIDSLRFMASSLAELASNMSDDDKVITQQSCDIEKFQLVVKKGVFPYEYINNWKKLDEEKLPTIQDFYSNLSNEHVSDKDYMHAQTVWKIFNIKTLGEYSDLYLKTDVLLLADVFENFR